LRLLWWWDETREFRRLLLFALVSALSFGNHMQTVMLAPAVFFILLSGDRKSLLDIKRFGLCTLFFLAPLLLYLTLPIRTAADAAIHWGDPDSLERFLAHVTGRSHRSAYVFSKTPWDYFLRTKEGIGFLAAQFAALLAFAIGGWLKLRSRRWKACFVIIILFDFFYTVFLNIISLEITPFHLATGIVLAILVGVGTAEMVKWCSGMASLRAGTRTTVTAACWGIPFLLLALNLDLCNQSRNYTGYEQAVNMFRTTGQGDILFLGGDNHVFPATYGRIVERMREDVTLYDRYDIIFRMPDLHYQRQPRTFARDEERNRVEKRMIEEAGGRTVYYAVFGPYAMEMPEKHNLISYGLLHRVMKEGDSLDLSGLNRVWKYYSAESFHERFERDYMNREIAAFYFFSYGKHLILNGHTKVGLTNLKLAAEIGFNDTLIHSETAVFLTNHGFFEEARQALERALVYNEDLSAVYNNWGYYHHRMGDLRSAVASFKKAAELKPDRFASYNNLGFALYELGDKKSSEEALRRSLAIHENQPSIKRFIQEHFAEDKTTP
jgi:tetratricopeptide (TPR) repeat protein